MSRLIPSASTRALGRRLLLPAGWCMACALCIVACGNRWHGGHGGQGGHGGHGHPTDGGQHEDGGHEHDAGEHEDGGHEHDAGEHEDGGHEHDAGEHEDGGHDHDGGAHSGATCPHESTLTYDTFGRQFMESYCTRCHSSALSGAARNGAPVGADFDTLDGILAHAHHIDQFAASGPLATNEVMPPSDPRPTLVQRQQLGEWLACETDGDGHPATVTWVTRPPQRVAVNTPFTASYTVSTEGELHVTELRACQGVVPDCGLHDYDWTVFTSAQGSEFSGSMALRTAGTWTVVGWIHVDTNPFISEPVTVVVE